MESMAEIAAAINLIDVKKENLRKSFLHLQSHSSFNLTVKWADLDSYFTTLRSSLHCEFHRLQTLYPHSDTTRVLARPELKSFCQNSDGLGLRRFISLSPDRLSLLAELPDAYRFAPDAAAMVLDAMAGFYNINVHGVKGTKLRLLNTSCVIMLECLMRVKPDVTIELMEKAMMVAVEWNQKMMAATYKEMEYNVLGFLLLVGSYGFINEFSMDELIDCITIAAKKRPTVDLCRQMIPANKINDVIQKLIDKDMPVVAVKYIIKLEKTEDFPPVSLLDERILKCMDEICKNGPDDYNKAVMKKEMKSLKLILKCIDEYGIESKYPKETLLALVRELNNRIANKPVGTTKAVCHEEQPPKKQKLVQPPVADLQLHTTTIEKGIV